MRVRLDEDQAERILWALRNDHLCNECEYDSKGNTIPGTECITYKLIKKFERVYSGSASIAGGRGGLMSKLSRREELEQAKIKGMERMTEVLIEDRKVRS